MKTRNESRRRAAGADLFQAVIRLVVILASIPAWAGQPALPSGVPNVFDPEVRARFQPVGVANLRGNPDFPVWGHTWMRDSQNGESRRDSS